MGKLVVQTKAEGRRSLRLAIGIVLAGGGALLPTAVGIRPAAAVIAPCGWHLSAPVVSRGLGSGGWSVSFIPDDPDQRCSTSIMATTRITGAGGIMPSNVSGNPSSVTLTATFVPESFPPGTTWSLRPFCADPPGNMTITVTAGGQTSSTAAAAPSCVPDLGGHSQVATVPGIQGGDFVVGMARTSTDNGYWEASAEGLSAAFGDAGLSASTGLLRSPIVGAAGTPTGLGHWLVASDGGVFSFGTATFHGSLGGVALSKPVVGMAATPDGLGYWLVASDGGVFSFGTATFHGSLGGVTLNKPVVGMAAPDGLGYWLVASDGGIFSFGDATFFGSTGGVALDQPVVGMAATRTGNGYWLVASDGGIFSFGHAAFFGSRPFQG